MDFGIRGKVALVCGASKGIAYATAEEFAKEGAQLAICSRDAAALADAAKRLEAHGADVWLINTGWSGGPYGVGNRMPLAQTRAMVRAAIDGSLRDVAYTIDPIFGLAIPQSCPGVPVIALDPRTAWGDANRWESAARQLARMFHANFVRYAAEAPAGAAAGAPLVG
jgi:phosphoenolpyruvate carboxykinase (ATP)